VHKCLKQHVLLLEQCTSIAIFKGIA